MITALIEGRAPAPDELSFQRGASLRRARAGFALEDYLSAYRVGQQVLWDAIVESAEETGVSYRLVLTLASRLMRHMDVAATHAAQAYVEFRQDGLAAVAKERRDLLEQLLAGVLPKAGPLAAAAERCNLGATTHALVAVALPLTPQSEHDAAELAGATFSRAGLHEPSALVVVRHGEIVTLLRLGTDGDADHACARLDQAHDVARREGIPLAIGVSTIAAGVGELPQAYQEAGSAVRFVAKDGGVAALTRLSPFEYLALTADDTARRLIDPRIATFLEEDRRRGGGLVDTLRAYAAADLNLKSAGARLHVHTNTARYRLPRVRGADRAESPAVRGPPRAARGDRNRRRSDRRPVLRSGTMAALMDRHRASRRGRSAARLRRHSLRELGVVVGEVGVGANRFVELLGALADEYPPGSRSHAVEDERCGLGRGHGRLVAEVGFDSRQKRSHVVVGSPRGQ